MPQVELQDVNKSYRVGDNLITAVNGVTLSVQKGEFVSVVGHSGSGKTTLLSMMGGILEPSSGRVVYEGSDIYGFDEDALSGYRAGKVGFIFQFASLLPVLTAKENLLLPTIFSGNGADGKELKAVEYLGMVGLKEKVDAYPSALSGGEQRRVAIARAMMNDPEIILADEPTGDLDEETEAEVMKFFTRMNRERSITFILVTHSSELAKMTARRLRMTHGELSEL